MLSGIAAETDAFGVSRIPSYAAQAVNTFSAPENRAALKQTWEQGLRKLLENAEPGSDHQLSFLRATPRPRTATRRSTTSRALLDGTRELDGLEVDTDLRWTLLTALARAGRADAERIDAELARDNTISGQEHAAAARAARPTAEAKAEAWELAMERDDVPNETQRSIVLAFQPHRPGGRAGAVRREVPRGGRDHVGGQGHPARVHRAGVHLPARRWPARSCSSAWTPGWRPRGQPGREALRREGRADVARALAAQAATPADRAGTTAHQEPSSRRCCRPPCRCAG